MCAVSIGTFSECCGYHWRSESRRDAERPIRQRRIARAVGLKSSEQGRLLCLSFVYSTKRSRGQSCDISVVSPRKPRCLLTRRRGVEHTSIDSTHLCWDPCRMQNTWEGILIRCIASRNAQTMVVLDTSLRALANHRKTLLLGR